MKVNSFCLALCRDENSVADIMYESEHESMANSFDRDDLNIDARWLTAVFSRGNSSSPFYISNS